MKARVSIADAQEGRRGFTLVELMLVIMIIVLISSVGVGLFSGTYNQMLVRKAGRNFYNAAQYARILAIEKQRPCRLEIIDSGKGFGLTIDEQDPETGKIVRVAISDMYFKPIEFREGIGLENVQIDTLGAETSSADEQQIAIVFTPNGTAQSALIQIGDSTTHVTVTIAASTGKAELHLGIVEELPRETIDLDDQSEGVWN